MKLDDVKAALAPFARFAELFTHNTLGVSYEDFYTKMITVNGEHKEFKIAGADFDRAKDALDFLNGLDTKKMPEPPPAPKEGEEAVELPGGKDEPDVPTTAAAQPVETKKGKPK